MPDSTGAIDNEIEAFAGERQVVRRWRSWPQEKKDLIQAIVRHNQDPSKTPLALGGAIDFIRAKGHSASQKGIRSYCREALGIEWGAWG